MNHPIRILYICTDWYELEGSSLSLIDLIQSIRDSVDATILVSAEGKVAQRFREIGIPVVVHPFFYLWDTGKPLKTVLHHPSKSTILRYLTLNQRCAKVIAEKLYGEIDIVHSNSSITTVGKDIAKSLKAKHVWHIREFLDLDFGITIYGGRNRLRRIINTADARICVSSAVSKHWCFSSKGTYVLQDAVKNDNHTETLASEKKPYFLFCSANISQKKGADIAVEAFCLSQLSSKGYRLKIVGHCEDSYKKMLLSIAMHHEEELYIDFIDYTDDINGYFAEATAFLMCSKCEAMGRVSVQAMWNHCPVIAYNSGGTTDFIHHKETGLLFDSINECATLMQDITMYNPIHITDKAYLTVKKYFSFEYYKKELSKIYQSLCPEYQS